MNSFFTQKISVHNCMPVYFVCLPINLCNIRVKISVARRPLNAYEKQSKTRDQAMYEAYRSGNNIMKTIADYFGVHYATVSRAVNKFEHR